MIRENKIHKLDDLVFPVFRMLGIEGKYRDFLACEAWNEVVGNMIASRTRVVGCKAGKLVVECTSSIVRSELSLVKEGLVGSLNGKLGLEVVSDIIFK